MTSLKWSSSLRGLQMIQRNSVQEVTLEQFLSGELDYTDPHGITHNQTLQTNIIYDQTMLVRQHRHYMSQIMRKAFEYFAQVPYPLFEREEVEGVLLLEGFLSKCIIYRPPNITDQLNRDFAKVRARAIASNQTELVDIAFRYYLNLL